VKNNDKCGITTKIFNDYYLKYLGISVQELYSGNGIFNCMQREKALNNWYFQHLIATNINGYNVFSITPIMYKEFTDFIVAYGKVCDEKLEEGLKIFFDSKLEKYTIRRMYRMTLGEMTKELVLDSRVIRLTKEILMNSIQELNDKEKIWERKKDEVLQGRQYVILDGNKIISYCKVSDIDYSGGNLTVYTNEKHRNKGYGMLVSIGVIKWCIENNIIPIYWVDKTNIPSVALAKKLGFEVMAEEIVIGTNTN
jgi:GNAT superfamily N-acetyltransferase